MDLGAELRRIVCPTLIFRGGRDGALLSEVEAAKMTAALPNGRCVVLPNSAHALDDADYKLFQENLLDFMSAAR